MQIKIAFIKTSGAGNDFILIDNMDGSLNLDQPPLARALCSRHYGVGADGLIVLESDPTVHFLMRYYNADGSYGGMCGNGGRCAARVAHLRNIAPESMKFRTLDHVYEAKVLDEEVCLKMKPVKEMHLRSLSVDQENFTGIFIDTGSPHFVLPVEDVRRAAVEQLGRSIRNHASFLPHGTNVDFVQHDSVRGLQIRTYERGVEGETLACGTGVVAAAVVASVHWSCTPPVRVETRSGEVLSVSFARDGNSYTDIQLQGSAHILFSGILMYDSTSGTLTIPLDVLSPPHSLLSR